MSPADDDLQSLKLDRFWRRGSITFVVGLLAVASLCGFVILPVLQGYQAGIDPYTAICRSLGILPGSPAAVQSQSKALAAPVSLVSWTKPVIDRLNASNPAEGARIAAESCAACHGEKGLSADPQQFPNMAGQSAFAIYKQLHDYKSGLRKNDVMQGAVASLSDAQMADAAAYFARQPQDRWDATWVQSAGAAADVLARTGDVRRGLAACESCHSPRAGGPIETPVLFAQTKTYLAAQMRAYKAGERRNDLYARMRDVAGKLTEAEIDQLAIYYSERR